MFLFFIHAKYKSVSCFWFKPLTNKKRRKNLNNLLRSSPFAERKSLPKPDKQTLVQITEQYRLVSLVRNNYGKRIFFQVLHPSVKSHIDQILTFINSLYSCQRLQKRRKNSDFNQDTNTLVILTLNLLSP